MPFSQYKATEGETRSLVQKGLDPSGSPSFHDEHGRITLTTVGCKPLREVYVKDLLNLGHRRT